MSRARVVNLVNLVSYQQQQGMQQRANSELAASKGTAPDTGNRVNALSSLPSVPLKPAPLLLVRLIRLIHQGTHRDNGGRSKSSKHLRKGPAAQCFFVRIGFLDRGGVEIWPKCRTHKTQILAWHDYG